MRQRRMPGQRLQAGGERQCALILAIGQIDRGKRSTASARFAGQIEHHDAEPVVQRSTLAPYCR